MKYGGWGKQQISINQLPIKKGKRLSERKKDLNKLKKNFPCISPVDIERVYNENNENIQETILNLSAFSNDINDTDHEKPVQSIELLEEMFEGIGSNYIRDVYGQCDENISQATAFLIEASNEDSYNIEEDFGNNAIGYVNKEALKKRLNKSFGEMIFDLFPTVDRGIAQDVYESCKHDLIETFSVLGKLSSIPTYEESPKPEISNISKYDQEYPASLGRNSSKAIKQGVWAIHSNNYFLDGNNLDAVKKISILKSSFPAIDDITVKEIFFQMGDNLAASVEKLKEMFPRNYREVPVEVPIHIPYKVNSSSDKMIHNEIADDSLLSDQKIPDSEYTNMIELMQRSRGLQDSLFQAASNAGASGNYIDAKKLTAEGKKHQKIYKAMYEKTYKETFRRNNEKFGLDTIDLHGLQAEEAISLLDSFLKKARLQHRKVEVITVI
jgi:hypothetical protein